MNSWLSRIALGLPLLAAPAWCGGTLTASQQNIVTSWLRQHANYRLATDADCACAIDIKQMRDGYGDSRYALPDYHPFAATGDFNDDGIEDFAVALIDRKVPDKFTLVVFNGPSSDQPAFIRSSLDLQSDRLFYFGSLRSKPYRLWVAPFNSDSGFKLTPSGSTYKTESLVE